MQKKMLDEKEKRKRKIVCICMRSATLTQNICDITTLNNFVNIL